MTYAVRNPNGIATTGLASFHFARRYSGNRFFFLFLLLLRCFSSEGFLHIPMNSVYDDKVLPYRVSPFGNLGVNGYLLLTRAYRSLSRPSSAPDAKSFSLRSLQLNLFNQLRQNYIRIKIIIEVFYPFGKTTCFFHFLGFVFLMSAIFRLHPYLSSCYCIVQFSRYNLRIFY